MTKNSFYSSLEACVCYWAPDLADVGGLNVGLSAMGDAIL